MEPSGVTEHPVANGNKISSIIFLKQDSVIFTLNFSKINHRFNFMLALLQSCTERIIESRLNELATDGALSTVRRKLNIQFPGTYIPRDWSLADVKMDNPFENTANVIFNKSGFVLMLEYKKGLFRLASNRPNVINFLMEDSKINEVILISGFSVSHSYASTHNIG